MKDVEMCNKIREPFSTVILFLVIRLFMKTLENPLDFNLEGKRSEIFDFSEQSNLNLQTKQCKCGEDILNDFCTEEQILQGCQEISNEQNNKRNFLRGLDDDEFCSEKLKLIADPTKTKMSDVFDLKFKEMNSITLGLLIISGISTIFGLFLLFAPKCVYYECELKLINTSFYYVILEGLALIGLNIALWVFYAQGEVGEFGDFLECKGVKQKFIDDYSYITDVKSYFIAFCVFNLLCDIGSLYVFIVDKVTGDEDN